MKALAKHLVARAFSAVALAALCACASTPPRDYAVICHAYGVSLAQYNTFSTSARLEALHSIQIDDVAGLRSYLESVLALDVITLGATARDPHTTPEELGHVWALLRVIAIQNEKFPVATMNTNPKVADIFKAAIADDPRKADQLRRQDWSKPKWVNWVD
jgi:hypothetical protein